MAAQVDLERDRIVGILAGLGLPGQPILIDGEEIFLIEVKTKKDERQFAVAVEAPNKGDGGS